MKEHTNLADSVGGVLFLVLDHGHITLVDSMGSDLSVVNAARVSYNKEAQELGSSDVKLIKYLAKHKHMSPFRQVQFQFRIKAPEFLMRQFYKHQVGCAWTADRAFVDMPWNEVSQRYVGVSEFDFYLPSALRKQSDDNKQCSTDEHVPDHAGYLREAMGGVINHCKYIYTTLLEAGVAKEQARTVLPLSIYTEVVCTMSLEAAVNFIRLRNHPGAQYEARLYARAMQAIVECVCPVSVEALLEETNK